MRAKSDRPKPINGPLTYVAAVVIGVLAVASVIMWAVMAGDLGDEVPVHFDASGEPTRWSDAAGGWGIVIVMAVVSLAMIPILLKPNYSNFPFKPVTDEGWQKIYRIVKIAIAGMGIAIALFNMTYTLNAVEKMEETMALPFLAVILGLTTFLLVGLIMVVKNDKKRANESQGGVFK